MLVDRSDSGEPVSPLLISALLLASAEHARRLSLAHPSVGEILAATGATRSRAYELRDALVASLPSLQRPLGRPAAPATAPSRTEQQVSQAYAQTVSQLHAVFAPGQAQPGGVPSPQR